MDFSTGMKILERSDDLLSEILLRLPSRSLFKFTCVSKRWNEAIMNHVFKKLYCERAGKTLACSYPDGRMLAIVQTNNKEGTSIGCPPPGMVSNFMPVRGEDVGAARCGNEFFPIERGYFITSSSDGLILCGHIPNIYNVGSPITGRWEMLPPPPPPESFPDNCMSVGLSSKEEDDGVGGKIINFRVIIATGTKKRIQGGPYTKVNPIETYSSRTREWRRSRLISEIPINIRHFYPPTFSGGYFHWFTEESHLIISYNPSLLDEEDDDNCNTGLVPKKHQHVVQVIRTPSYVRPPIIWRSDNGQTIWFGVSNFEAGLEIFRKRDDSDEWACICRSGPKYNFIRNILGIKCTYFGIPIVGDDDDDNYDDYVNSVWMMAFTPWNPKLLLLWYMDRICVYDCIQNKLDHEVLLDGDRRHSSNERWDYYPFFHSLSNSRNNLNPQTTFSA